ncbi:cyclodeaminase/cyclohydrolase family protein [Nocardioides sp. InS609-2]|uniref:cyclodeaminase/cyclohydrolase family protein n=1 Tax=Nocardioides sp. InS609-2 TaxID=2760705 RepID=UPI0020C05DC2|nr:cyclodeaminase/cyclohydrolase family protein [Nocardioides sp. InS609-2]
MAYLDSALGDFIALVGEQTPAPGGGAVAAITASLAAGLVAMTGPENGDEVTALGRRAAALADEDAAAYTTVIEARHSGLSLPEALTRATEVPLEIAGTAAAIAQRAAEVFRSGRPAVRGDVATALLLAEGATRSAAYLVEVNVEAGGGSRELVDIARGHIATAVAARELAGGRAPVPVDH